MAITLANQSFWSGLAKKGFDPNADLDDSQLVNKIGVCIAMVEELKRQRGVPGSWVWV